jgi:DNA repair exonuclease SbcCD ATPase subunit
MACPRAQRRRLPLLVALSLIAGPALAQSPNAQTPSRDELARRISEKVRQLQQLRQQRHLARQSHQQKQSALEQQTARLRRDLKQVQADLDEQQATVAERQRALDEARRERDRAIALIDAARDRAAPVAEAMQQRVAAGVPWQKEMRAEKLGAIEKQLQAEDPIARAEAVMELMGFAGRELERARTIELTNRPVMLEANQRRTHAYVLRLGLAGAGFVSEDQQTLGLATLEDGAQHRWQRELSKTQQRHLKAAIATLRKNRPPELIPVPLRASSAKDVKQPTPSPQKATSKPVSQGAR